MAVLYSDFAAIVGKRPVPDVFSMAGTRLLYVWTRTAETLAAADSIDMGPLPGGVIPVSFALAFVRSGADTTLAATLGILNAARTANDVTASSGGGIWATTAAAGSSRVVNGPVDDQANAAMIGCVAQETPRNIGLVLTGAASTPANLQKIILCIEVRPALPGGV